jgi:hypothetical protein
MVHLFREIGHHMNNNLSNLKKKIRDRERRFKQMTPEKQRVAIAKDVIRSIGSEDTITPKPGTYLDNWNFDEARFYYSDKYNMEIRDILLQDLPECSACAIGSMFVCAILRDDDLTLYKFREKHGEDYRVKLRKFFSQGQLDLIECAFETSYGYNRLGRTGKIVSQAVKFGMKYDNDRERMLAIMKNIVTNKGEFIPA